MAVTSAAVTSAAVRIINAGALVHWLLGPIGSKVNQCCIAPRSTTAYRDGVQRQRSYLTIPLSQFRGQAAAISGAHMASFTFASHTARPTLNTHTGMVWGLVSCSVYLWVHTWKFVDSVVAVVLPSHRQLGQLRRWRNPPVYRPLVDLLTMEERHLIITYRFDLATIQELCTQLEPDLMSPIRHPTGIPPDVQVLSVLHFRVVQSVGCPAETHHHRLLDASQSCFATQVPFLQEDGPDDGVVTAVEPVEPVDSDEEEAEEEDNDNRESVIQQYFQ
ncbi:hypothetical protein NDU88_004769 [Pleurodeles waltl]|uniref:Uncharacterized protein n=1 Tax=Pleurodeles waltl TaxID=8319 RepID=A0AAV7NN86_PLEWA|nr:hypothetical protein NDU88_004769 [Pleurodeles waltl]